MHVASDKRAEQGNWKRMSPLTVAEEITSKMAEATYLSVLDAINVSKIWHSSDIWEQL
jgi:hypothetical protein